MKLIVKCVADDGSEWDRLEDAQARDAEVKQLRDSLRTARAMRTIPAEQGMLRGGEAPTAVP